MAQKIEIVRGTTETIRIDIVDAEDRPYTIAPGETVIFGVKRKETDEELIIRKAAKVEDTGVYSVKLYPEETEALTCAKYFYDVSLESGENFYNVVEVSPFVLIPNITKRGCLK